MNAVHVWYADGADGPRSSPFDVLSLAETADRNVHVTLGWTIERPPWLDTSDIAVRTVLAGYGLGHAVNTGRVTALPVRLSAVPRMIADERPDVAVVTGVRRGDGFAFGSSVGWADVLARSADRVVVEVDEGGVDLGAPLIRGNVVATITRPPAEATPTAASRAADDVDLHIGALVSSLIPAGATLQFGPGGIGEGIARSLDKPVHVHSGLVTDSIAEMHERGVLRTPVVAAYAWGGEPITSLAHAGMLRLTSCTETHDLTALASIPNFVGCNTALQVGLDGSVNVERIGRRVIAGVGGHSDFCAGASRSPGGLSIIALRSTTSTGESTIVAHVEQVSTQRSDVDVVVTEHGIADLRGLDGSERVRRIADLAAPEHRAALVSGDAR